MVDTCRKVRLVRCPKCRNLLPEPPGVPIYSCGGCGIFLQAKRSNAERSKVGEQGLPNANESRREENAAAEEETVSNETTLKMGKEKQSAAAVVDRDESSCGEKSEAMQEDNICSSQSLNLESGSNSAKENGCCSNQSLQIEEETAAMGDISVPHSEPQVEEEKNRNFEPNVEEQEGENKNFDPQVEEEEEEKNRNFDDEVEATVAGSVVSEPQVEEEEEKNRNFEPNIEEQEGENKNFRPQVEEEERNQNFDDEVEATVAGSVVSEPQVEEEEEEKNRNFEPNIEEQEGGNKNFERQVEELEEKNRNFDNEVETAVAGSVVSDQIVAASNVSTSDSVIIEQEAAQNNGSTEETAREALCQETASSLAVEEQFQNLDTYVDVRNQEAKKVGVINESESRRTRNEQLELLRSEEEIIFISKEEKKLREEMLLLNHLTPDDDSVSDMLMIKGLDPVRRTHPTRHRTRSESYDQWGPRYGNKKFLDSSSLHSEQDKTELLRIMVLQLEEEVRRMRHSGQSSTSQAETSSSEMNRFYSGTLNRQRNRFSQPYFSPSSGFSSPQQQRRYYPPSSPSWDFETKSVDQLSNNSYQQRERVHVPKRHVRAVAGGSPVLSCYRCSVVLQLPEDFLLSKRKRLHWLKCGSCSTLLRFILQNGTHIVPHRDGGPEENGKRETEEARRKRSSALHRLMGYSSVTQLVIGSGESSPSNQTSV